MSKQHWTTHADLKAFLQQKWNSGDLLRAAYTASETFPLCKKLIIPNKDDFLQLPDILIWMQQLTASGQQYRYEFSYRVFSHKAHGKNELPTHAIFPDLACVLGILKKQSETALFLRLAQTLTDAYPPLTTWVVAHPFVLLEHADVTPILQVLDWFTLHRQKHLYLRQLDIAGVDTKFIERHTKTISQMLDLILPPSTIDMSTNKFEARYHLNSKPILVRFRILDARYAIGGLMELSIPLADFERLNLPVETVFFTENEINFLSFPAHPSACVIFSKGYGVELLQNARWLCEKTLYYWGDIDTHGFHILSMTRKHFPQIQSIFMDEALLCSQEWLWVTEDKPFLGVANHLTQAEQNLLKKLQTNTLGTEVRLEQERIPFSIIASGLSLL